MSDVLFVVEKEGLYWNSEAASWLPKEHAALFTKYDAALEVRREHGGFILVHLEPNEKHFVQELESAARMIREGVWTCERAVYELRNIQKKEGEYWLP